MYKMQGSPLEYFNVRKVDNGAFAHAHEIRVIGQKILKVFRSLAGLKPLQNLSLQRALKDN
jgi:hypothetical protein